MNLFNRIETHQATIAVIGLGYVGLPLATAFAKAGPSTGSGRGFHIIGIDTDPARVEAINNGRSYIQDVPSEQLAPLVGGDQLSVTSDRSSVNGDQLSVSPNFAIRNPKFLATTDYAALANADAIFICVPTPFDQHKTPDLSYIVAASEGIARYLRPGHLVILPGSRGAEERGSQGAGSRGTEEQGCKGTA